MLADRSMPSLLDDVARDFGDGHLQHHLVAAANRDRIDDPFHAADQAGGHVGGLLCFDRGCGGPAQHHGTRPVPSIWMSEFGSDCFSAARTPLRSRLTAMS